MFHLTKNLLILIVFIITELISAETVSVKTQNGEVLGKLLKSSVNDFEYYGFMGIPFAAPPVRELRFLPPQPLKPWNDTYKATQEKPPCIQYNYNVRKGAPFGIYGQEDCLYLNVFTPSLDGNVPVLVYLYNEMFRNSYNGTRDYGPDFFIEDNIAVVTINYRLSVFGFLSFDDEVLSGNSGLKDIVTCLKWLQDNIGNFGGDPSKITLMGVRGGAAAVEILLNTPANKLFHSAILQSGSAWSTSYMQDNGRKRAFKLAEHLDIHSSRSDFVLKKMQKVSVEDLLSKEFDATPADYFREQQKMLLSFGPTIESNSEGLHTQYPKNNDTDFELPILIGSNSGEGIDGSFQYLIEPRYLNFIEKEFPLLLPIRTNFRFEPYSDAYNEAIKEIKKCYFKDMKLKIDNVPEYVKYIGDVSTSYSVDYTCKYLSERNLSPVFYYYFDYYNELNENKNNMMKHFTVGSECLGSAPGDELCYLLKCPDLVENYKSLKESSTEVNIFQRKLVRMWVNFVKYGNPTPQSDNNLNGLNWIPYNRKLKNYLYIGKEIKQRDNLNEKRFQFWDNFIEKWSRNIEDGVVSLNFKPKEEL